MSDPISSISRYLSADVQALAVLAQNVANTSTPGYRSVRLLPDFSNAAGLGAALPSLEPGPIAVTDRALDLALTGDGFFTLVEGTELVLTRRGDFRRGADGMLVDAAGRPLIGHQGSISVPHDNVTVRANGEVMDGDTLLGQLLLLEPAAGSSLVPAPDGGMYLRGEGVAADGQVMQRSLEGSNVDPARESIALIELSRHAESVQRAIAIYDRAMEAGINKIGEN